MNIYYILVIVFFILLFFSIVSSSNSKEPFQGALLNSPNLIQVNGKRISRDNYSTMVHIYHGNTDEIIYLINGNPLSQIIWHPIIQNIQKRKLNDHPVPSIITYDLRGIGTSSFMQPSDSIVDTNIQNVEWSWDDYVEDLRQVHLQTSGNSRVSFAGWGFGGMIAQLYAMKYPNNINNLYLLQTTGSPPNISSFMQQLVSDMDNNTDHYPNLSSTLVNNILCNWFYIQDTQLCNNTSSSLSNIDQTDTQSYLTVRSLLINANSKVLLNNIKLMMNFHSNIIWKQNAYPFSKVIVLSTNDDLIASPNISVQLMDAIRERNVSILVPIIKQGKHFFTFETSNYIANLFTKRHN